MLVIAVLTTGTIVSLLSLLGGWIIGARLGDDRGVIAYILVFLSGIATVAWTLVAAT